MNGELPPHPAFGHLLPRRGEGTRLCHLSRVGEKGHDCVTSAASGIKDTIVSPLPRRGEETRLCHLSRSGRGRCGAAGEGSRRARVLCLATGRGPLIRPSATFSRVGEKGHGCVTSPASGRRDTIVSPLPRRGERTRLCHLSRVGEKGHDCVTSPVPGEVAAEQRVRVRGGREYCVWQRDAAPSSGLRPPSPAWGRRDTIVSPLPRRGERTRLCHLLERSANDVILEIVDRHAGVDHDFFGIDAAGARAEQEGGHVGGFLRS